MNVVIVESPAKAKTITKYLGKGYEVYASYGHVRDLPAKDGSVDPDHDFAMLWDVDTKSAKRLADIAKAVKDADRIILATDPDREGEAISWHVLEVLKAKKVLGAKPVQRVVFNAITKAAILEAMQHPREIDAALVDAYLARRALDYLVGFNLSPVLWRKLPGARSAGRVQSVALRLVCDRELEIEKFVSREYWSIAAHLRTAAGAPFIARLVGADGTKISRLDIGKGAEAEAFKAALDAAKFSVASIEAKPASGIRRRPSRPRLSSRKPLASWALLRRAPCNSPSGSTKAPKSAARRWASLPICAPTASTCAPEAIKSARSVIGKEFGANYVPKVPRKYVVKSQECPRSA